MRRRVLRHSLGHWVDPAAAFAALYSDSTDVAWLDSGTHAQSGMSVIAPASRVVNSDECDLPILEFLKNELRNARVDPPDAGFALGWIGWLGYELRHEIHSTPRARDSPYPDAAFLFVDRAIEFDHASRSVALVALGEFWSEELAHWRDHVAETLAAPAQPPLPSPAAGTATWRYSDDEYLAMIDSCKASIAEGDAYQLCLTTEVTVLGHHDPLTTYLALRVSSPSHHGALLRIGEISLLSSSPEQFLSVSPDGTVQSSPVKGTRRRATDAAGDEALLAELHSSEKERAENLMIVDLMRNDIGRVSRVGTVAVTSLLAVESYAQVHQLVSTVRGQLADGLDAIDAVAACFPAGSMTGAPKVSAMSILDSLEERPRGIYSGAFGYFGLDGRVDLGMVIRSIVLDAAGATVGSGGGITALSDPVAELEEVRLKAAALLRVLGVPDT